MYCDYCGSDKHGLTRYANNKATFVICQPCLKKVFDKVLKPETKEVNDEE